MRYVNAVVERRIPIEQRELFYRCVENGSFDSGKYLNYIKKCDRL